MKPHGPSYSRGARPKGPGRFDRALEPASHARVERWPHGEELRSGPVGAPAGAPILIVDDHVGSRLALRAMLAPLGHPIVEVGCGRDALRAVKQRSFAVILMDVRLPTMDGCDTADLIGQRARSAHTPIIFVSVAGGDERQAAAAYASGAVDFICAPIRPEFLRAKVSALVRAFSHAQELERSIQSALRDSEVRAEAVLQSVGDGIVTADEYGLIESLNVSARRLFGYEEAEVVGQPMELLIAPIQRAEFAASTRVGPELLSGGLPVEAVETVGCRKDGSGFALEVRLSQTQVGTGQLLIGCLRDISDRQAYTDALEHRALHDELTGLANRALFSERIDWSIARGERANESRVVLKLNLDNFRAVNDTHGRDAGDAVLRAVADRLRDAVSDADAVARLDGDSFGVLPAGQTDIVSAATVAWNLRVAFEQPFRVGEREIAVSASFGIAFFPQHGRTTAELLRCAALAVKQAKAAGSGLRVYSSAPQERTERRFVLLSELRDGIERGELVLHYQPKVELRRQMRVVGVEALVRWQHPTRGLLTPDQFIPDADASPLIAPLTEWVLDEALRQQSAWRHEGVDLTMAVNISARCLSHGSRLPESVARLTKAWGITPGRLILELTESALIGSDAPDVLRTLNVMGERLAIDDFGTGHSSLVYLQQLPLHELKIDRSFVTNLTSAPNDAVIARSTIDLAHNLGLTVVAEGIEDTTTLQQLLQYGCDVGQGYLFSRPLPADELTAWAQESPFGLPSTGTPVRSVSPVRSDHQTRHAS
jgi:diguanylate cyclase (GGDEF)-like protein/PAS domain S-box-containing protein